MFRPIVAIIRFSSESMVVVLYGIGITILSDEDLMMAAIGRNM